MNTPDKSVNAWILLSEDDPQGTNYTSPNSDYQMLIKYGVYKYVDMLSMCFAVTVPVSAPPGTPPSYTIAMQAASHGPYTNQQYMDAK
jgi:hypothetical protein